MDPLKIRVDIWFFSYLKGEMRGVKRRDGHYQDSCEGHIHVMSRTSLTLGFGEKLQHDKMKKETKERNQLIMTYKNENLRR